jgi:arginine utilization protein RocB
VTLTKLKQQKQEQSELLTKLINKCTEQLRKFIFVTEEETPTDAKLGSYLFTIGELAMVCGIIRIQYTILTQIIEFCWP